MSIVNKKLGDGLYVVKNQLNWLEAILIII